MLHYYDQMEQPFSCLSALPLLLLAGVLASAQILPNTTHLLSLHNASLHAQLQISANSPAHRDQIAKEGSSTVIECNLNASQNGDVVWFNSKGHPLGEVEGGKLVVSAVDKY